MISTDQLGGGYGRLTVLKSISVDVQPGELVAVIGANGAGKSTLLRCIQGTIRPTSGKVRVDGKDVAGKSADQIVRLGLTMVPETRDLFPTLTVNDNLLLGGWRHRKSAGGRDMSNETLQQVHKLFPVLKERGLSRAGSLSGGQQQMVAIGRALMTRPRSLMLDEPSLGLAPLIVRQIFSALQQLRDQGMALLVVEQNARAILKICKRAYVLERGSVVRHGTAQELLADTTIAEAYLGAVAA